MAAAGSISEIPLSFIGRENELDELRSLLDACERLITVVAPGGYGKSRLVSRLCQQIKSSYAHRTVEILLASVN